ncbi:MAG: Hpt domain-containing protein [Planctomycetaceae bacterium]|nr:Hpt domain-containing protein [Planctomycetaceae bacterium]
MSRSSTLPNAIHSLLANDPDLREIVWLFVNEMPLRIQKLLNEYQTKDWEKLSITAHQLKGTAGSYGFSEVSPVAAQLEQAAKSHSDENEILQILNELIRICERVVLTPDTDC